MKSVKILAAVLALAVGGASMAITADAAMAPMKKKMMMKHGMKKPMHAMKKMMKK
jgi:hypothetical protein